jgi:hypothetical protein
LISFVCVNDLIYLSSNDTTAPPMKVLVFVVATLLVAAGTVSADSKNSLLTAQGGARVGGKQQALQALGVGQGLVKAAVDAEAKVSSAIEDTCTRVPLSVCLGKGEQMLAADAHGKTLVGWWQFDDNSGYDSSGNGGYAKPVPEVGPAQGGVGASASLDGQTSVVLPHHEAMQGQGMTVAFWIYLLQDSGGMYRYIMRKGAEGDETSPTIQLHQESRRLHIRVKTEGQDEERFDSVGFIPKRRWTHVGLVLEGEQARLYINGIRDQLLVLRGRVRFNNGPITLGGGGSNAGVKSFIDDVRVYNEGLEEARMHSLAHGALGPVSPDFAKLGCNNQPCTYAKAQHGCPETYHLCAARELYAGGLQVARAQGWFLLNTRVWPAKAPVHMSAQEQRLAICCQDA